VGKLAGEVRREAQGMQRAARDLVTVLEARTEMLGLGEDAGRLDTARDAASLVAALAAENDATGLAEVLGNRHLGVTEEVLGRSLKSAGEVLRALEEMDWGLLEAIAVIEDDPEAGRILERLRSAARNNEFQESLRPVLVETRRRAQMLLARRVVT